MTLVRIILLVLLSPLWATFVMPPLAIMTIVAGLQLAFSGKSFNPWRLLMFYLMAD